MLSSSPVFGVFIMDY